MLPYRRITFGEDQKRNRMKMQLGHYALQESTEVITTVHNP